MDIGVVWIALLDFDNVIRRDIDNIHADTVIIATFNLYQNGAVQNTYGHYTAQAVTTIQNVEIHGSPIRHEEEQIGFGIDERGDFRAIVHRLTDGVTDYVDAEWFSRTNIDRWRITNDNRIYRVVSKRSHENLRDVAPYMVLILQRMMDSAVD